MKQVHSSAAIYYKTWQIMKYRLDKMSCTGAAGMKGHSLQKLTSNCEMKIQIWCLTHYKGHEAPGAQRGPKARASVRHYSDERLLFENEGTLSTVLLWAGGFYWDGVLCVQGPIMNEFEGRKTLQYSAALCGRDLCGSVVHDSWWEKVLENVSCALILM